MKSILSLILSALATCSLLSKDTLIDSAGYEVTNDHLLCITIPKSGTHLLLKCLTLFNIKGIAYNYEATKKFAVPQHSKFTVPKESLETFTPKVLQRLTKRMQAPKKYSFIAHLPHSPATEKFVNKYTRIQYLMIRDPRDQVVSFAHTVFKSIPQSASISFNDVLLSLIEGKSSIAMPQKINMKLIYALIASVGVVKFYNAFLPWREHHNVCTVKFENLVGTYGGGSKEAQIAEVQKIGHHVGLELSLEKVNEIVKNLFGNTLTFREGHIGSWKKYFTQQHKDAFKRMPGATKLLIDLGYETDSNW